MSPKIPASPQLFTPQSHQTGTHWCHHIHADGDTLVLSEVKTHLQSVSHPNLSWIIDNKLVVVECVTSRVQHSSVPWLSQRHNSAIGPQSQQITTQILHVISHHISLETTQHKVHAKKMQFK